VLREHKAPVRSVAFSRASDRIASGSDDRTVRLWDATRGTELAVLPRDGKSVGVSPDAERIARGREEGAVRASLWLNFIRTKVKKLAFSPEGGRIIATLPGGRTAEVEIIASVRDDQADVALAPLFSCVSPEDDVETIVEWSHYREAIAYFPVRLANIATHPAGRAWAGMPYYYPYRAETHLYVISLEGDVTGNDN